MKPYPSFSHGVGLAVVLSFIGYSVATFASITIAINVIAASYLVYLLYNAPARTGRVAAGALWLVGTAVASTLDIGHGYLLLWHASTLWLTRSWCYLTTPLQALLDLGLWLVSFTAAAIAVGHTANLGLALWALLLVQATWPLLAEHSKAWFVPHQSAPGETSAPHTASQSFDTARQTAEAALKQLNSAS